MEANWVHLGTKLVMVAHMEHLDKKIVKETHRGHLGTQLEVLMVANMKHLGTTTGRGGCGQHQGGQSGHVQTVYLPIEHLDTQLVIQ